MARSVDTIYNAILANKATHAELNGLNSTSNTAFYKLIFFIVAVAIWTHEKLWDVFKAEVVAIIDAMIPGKAPWYRQLCFDFRYGQNLNAQGKYDDTGLTQAQIEAMKIIKYASVTEADGKLRIKVAAQASNKPSQLTAPQLAAFSEYIEKLKYAGVVIIKNSNAPDSLKIELDVWFNPLVLKSDGSMIDGSSASPVEDGINRFLNDLPFNGEYANTRLIDYLQSLPGVVLPVPKVTQSKYGLFPFTVIDEKLIPDAGYFELLHADLTVNYREYV